METVDHEMPAACAVIREEFSAFLDDELDPDARAEVDAHLVDCAGCLRALDGMKKVSDLYATLPRVGAPEAFEGRVRGAVRPGLLRFPKVGWRGGLALVAAGVAMIASVYFVREEGRGALRPQMAMQAEMRSAAGPAAVVAGADDVGGDVADADVGNASVPEPAARAMAADASAATSVVPAPEPPAESLRKPMEVSAGELVDFSVSAPAPMAAPRAKTAPSLKEVVGAKNAPEAATRVRWEAAGRVLFLVDDAWVETGGAGVDTVDVEEDSREFQALVAEFPDLLALTAAEIPVVFQTGDETWYRLLPKKN